MPHKPLFHALGPIGLRMSAIYEYGVYIRINTHPRNKRPT